MENYKYKKDHDLGNDSDTYDEVILVYDDDDSQCESLGYTNMALKIKYSLCFDLNLQSLAMYLDFMHC